MKFERPLPYDGAYILVKHNSILYSMDKITASIFEDIIGNHSIQEIRVDTHSLSTIVDIGIKTGCESRKRKVIVQRFANVTVSDKIQLIYNPVNMIDRLCLFVKPDDANQKSLDTILGESGRIEFFFYDTSDMIGMYKGVELREILQPIINNDVVIVFYTPEVRNHLKSVRDSYRLGSTNETASDKSIIVLIFIGLIISVWWIFRHRR